MNCIIISVDYLIVYLGDSMHFWSKLTLVIDIYLMYSMFFVSVKEDIDTEYCACRKMQFWILKFAVKIMYIDSKISLIWNGNKICVVCQLSYIWTEHFKYMTILIW